nr:MAG TPA: hypothetical protein [Crassvirales sp.]
MVLFLNINSISSTIVFNVFNFISSNITLSK